MAEWFRVWFDTEYYHQLYINRDNQEAKLFISNLLKLLQIPSKSMVCDLGCGRGRHAETLANAGYKVTGLDISDSSLDYALEQKIAGTQFFTHDMRKNFGYDIYQAVFNLFTSFGYFETDEEHLQVIKNIECALLPGGFFVLDFFNAHKLISGLVAEEKFTRNGVDFKVSRYLENNKVIKKIIVETQEERIKFMEQVKLFELEDIQRFLNATSLQIEHIFGDFNLNPYLAESSDRLIIIAKKC